MTLFVTIIQIGFVPLVAPLIVGIIRTVKARMAGRKGASVLQPYRDILKLFRKDEVISKDASWISRFAPFVIFATTLFAAALVPVIPGSTLMGAPDDLFVVISLIALGTFFLALLGLDAGGTFGGLGSSREMTLASLAEGGLLFTLLPLALLAETTDLSAMFAATGTLAALPAAALIVAFFGFLIVLLAENARYPFDNPATHLELTMVHEAMIIEMSGKRLALVEWASWTKLAVFMLLGANLFWKGSPEIVGAEILLLLGKVALIAFAIAFIESTTPKLRYFRLPELLITAFILGVIALTMVIV